ncbi:unnamed protein product [Vitrella brassicaformis CCMP3155]|uniref:Uncharacterized protein n=1 Tax=Vitrella brassicaformis (strain CCMP3155) TaxID=1169540 RepID=A0A0G4H5S3_VITBC|nr:unnamed protein product [Vitrella brassicaformis CCMP3155]|eukprot:CEM39024.1 unnamed protein product [Vitrella brassicaformis CCMP3155]
MRTNYQRLCNRSHGYANVKEAVQEAYESEYVQSVCHLHISYIRIVDTYHPEIRRLADLVNLVCRLCRFHQDDETEAVDSLLFHSSIKICRPVAG